MIANLRRYPEYKESGLPWLGGIPRHWQTGPGFAAFREKQVKNVGLREKTVLSLSYGRIVVKPPEKLHGLVPASFETYQIVDPGDIIIRSTDLQNDWTSLRVGIVRNRGIITSAYLCFRTMGSLSPEYGYLLLHAFDLMKVFYGMGSGLRQNLDFRDFKRMLIFVPPPDEQATIVRFLDWANGRLERAIRAKRKVIALLNEQKQAIIHRAVTRGLDPSVALKPSGIPWLGEIPKHWEEISVGAGTVLIQTGPFGSQLHSHEYVQGGIPVVNPSHMRDGQINADPSVTVSDLKMKELGRHQLCIGDIVAARRGELGRCAAVTAKEAGWLCGTGSLLIRCKPSVFAPDYFQQVFSSQGVRDSLSLASVGATMDNLNAGMVARLRLPLPTMEEQLSILGFVENQRRQHADTIAAVEGEIALLREYRTRLVADVVTGKLDVRAVAQSLPAEAEESAVVAEVNDRSDENDSETALNEDAHE